MDCGGVDGLRVGLWGSLAGFVWGMGNVANGEGFNVFMLANTNEITFCSQITVRWHSTQGRLCILSMQGHE